MTLRENPGWTRWGDPPPINPLTWLRHFHGQDGINSSLWAIPGQARFMGGKMGMGRERRTPAAAARKSGNGGFVAGSAETISSLELGCGTLGVCRRKLLPEVTGQTVLRRMTRWWNDETQASLRSRLAQDSSLPVGQNLALVRGRHGRAVAA